jgi:hypothetical protein
MSKHALMSKLYRKDECIERMKMVLYKCTIFGSKNMKNVNDCNFNILF